MKKVYIIGALKNPIVPEFTNALVEAGFDAFSEWYTPGPEADQYLLDYAKRRGWSYKRALNSYAAEHIFSFDYKHLQSADLAVMLMPCGKSGHLELGWHLGQGKPGFILFDSEPERFDLMYRFATDIFFNQQDLLNALQRFK